jgi:hypothetical protein
MRGKQQLGTIQTEFIQKSTCIKKKQSSRRYYFSHQLRRALDLLWSRTRGSFRKIGAPSFKSQTPWRCCQGLNRALDSYRGVDPAASGLPGDTQRAMQRIQYSRSQLTHSRHSWGFYTRSLICWEGSSVLPTFQLLRSRLAYIVKSKVPATEESSWAGLALRAASRVGDLTFSLP